ncbi:MAG: HAD-IIB family hydrolase [Candidatus Kaiserbacteria bacterium]|nr:MAG: HAD-IIB family hydrolase [Candidatus Kaiserbacteria bacterium]
MPFEIDLLQLVQLIGYPGLFGIIFLESGVFFGFFLPGGSLLFTSGVLASAGIFNIWILAPLLVLAAILGDNVGYWFGAKVGLALFKRADSRFFKQQHLEQTNAFFKRYGKSTILLARFVPVVRTFAPILAGVGSMEYRVFFFYNAVGALLWAGGVTLAGYTLGRAIPDAENYITPIVLAIIVLSSIPLLFEWWRRHAPVKRCPKAIIFDLDNTLAESFQKPTPEVAQHLARLLRGLPVAVMSGASFERMQTYLLSALPPDANLANLHLFPDTCASCFLCKDGAWTREFNHSFGSGEFERVTKTLEAGISETGIMENTPQYGEKILARDNQVTLAAIGIDAPADLKAAWDPDRKKRNKLARYLRRRLKDFDVRVSGRTAIDITHKGVDKAMGVRWFSKRLGVEPKDMLFVGDDLKRGGNDAMVIPTGIKTREVAGPAETARILRELCSVCGL